MCICGHRVLFVVITSVFVLKDAASGVVSAPCARVLLLVAHPDDEVLFAGEALLGRAATLPGGCRRAQWHVVSATNGDVKERREDLRRSLKIARAYGLAYAITEEVWDFLDCNLPYCETFPDSASGKDFNTLLSDLLVPGRWDFVVTHNLQGEYHHVQHVGMHKAVGRVLASGGGNMPRLLVFNPLPEVNVSMSVGKARMLESYLSGPGVKAARVLLLHALSQNSEHLVEVSQFTRPPILSLAYFAGALEHGALHFQYAWAMAPHIDWGELGHYAAHKAVPIADDMLFNTRIASCPSHNARGPQYPMICTALQQHFEERSSSVRERLLRMEVDNFVPEPMPEGAVDPHSSLTCLQKLSPLTRFGAVGGWTIVGKATAPLWMELLIVRPILVGWRNGYKGRTYKIVGATPPLKIDLHSGSARVLGVAHRPSGSVVVAQPHDVIGWRLLGQSAGAKDKVAGDGDGVVCLGGHGERMGETECDDSGMCVFGAAPPPGVRIEKVVPEQYEQNAHPRQRRAHPAYPVRLALDISQFLEPHTSYEELMTLRNRIEHPDLGLFEDKIRLRKELLPSMGVPSTPSIHLSNTDFEVAKHLHGRRAYVVKPSHMSESQNVFVVRDGVNLLQQAWGYPNPLADTNQIQAAVDQFKHSTALDWECKALVGARPGVIVEDLVLAEDAQGKFRVDEYKFYTVWGEVIVGENVPFSSGAAMEISRAGDILTARVNCPPICVASCYPQMVEMAEKVARKSRSDFLRVDLLIQGRCDAIYVSEVELFPASDFSAPIKKLVAERWLWGYGF